MPPQATSHLIGWVQWLLSLRCSTIETAQQSGLVCSQATGSTVHTGRNAAGMLLLESSLPQWRKWVWLEKYSPVGGEKEKKRRWNVWQNYCLLCTLLAVFSRWGWAGPVQRFPLMDGCVIFCSGGVCWSSANRLFFLIRHLQETLLFVSSTNLIISFLKQCCFQNSFQQRATVSFNTQNWTCSGSYRSPILKTFGLAILVGLQL